MGGKQGGKFRVAEYYMSLHIGVCTAGRNIELLSVKVGDKIAWRGNMQQNDVVRIDKTNLFGGNKKEGGVRGLLWWLNGNDNQRLPAALSDRYGIDYDKAPGFRGVASFFLTGFKITRPDGLALFFQGIVAALTGQGISGTNLVTLVAGAANEIGGFMLGANNPYVKTISARVRRAPEGLNPSTAMIRLPNSSEGRAQYAANPAHIVFECMTNPVWGMGESLGAFDIGSFERCAQTLYDEKFGLCILWTRQSSIEEFIKDVLDHAQGAVFVDPSTGKHTMKLLRGDYNVDSLPVITPDNARLTNFKRRVWGEISNEVVVTWTNPETGKESTIAAQDLGAIASQGGVASTSRNYHGIASQALATEVAERDLAALVYPIITLDAEVTRAFWKSVTFGVVALSWAEYGIDRATFRISKVSNGSTSRTIKLSLYEDVFALDKASYLGSADTGWVDPSTDPDPLTNIYIGTAPAFLAAAVMGLEDPGHLRYPQAMTLLLAAPDTIDDVGYELVTKDTNVVGETVSVSLGEQTLTASWLLTDSIPQETRTFIDRPAVIGAQPRVGDFLLFVGADDFVSEIGAVRTVWSKTFAIDRGLLDTVPREWSAGTRVYVVPAAVEAADPTVRSVSEIATYKLLTKTSRATLEEADAPEVSVVLTNRAHRPLRPANVRVGGTAFGTATLPAGADNIEITWSNRNRADESTQVLLWTDASVTPETGQATRIRLLVPTTRAVIRTIPDLTGESYTLPRTSLESYSSVIVQVESTYAGRTSLQSHEILLVVA